MLAWLGKVFPLSSHGGVCALVVVVVRAGVVLSLQTGVAWSGIRDAIAMLVRLMNATDASRT